MYLYISIQVGPDENLKDVTLKILQNRVATVPVTHSFSDDGSYPQLLYLASLSEILKRKLLFIYLFFWVLHFIMLLIASC